MIVAFCSGIKLDNYSEAIDSVTRSELYVSHVNASDHPMDT